MWIDRIFISIVKIDYISLYIIIHRYNWRCHMLNYATIFTQLKVIGFLSTPIWIFIVCCIITKVLNIKLKFYRSKFSYLLLDKIEYSERDSLEKKYKPKADRMIKYLTIFENDCGLNKLFKCMSFCSIFCIALFSCMQFLSFTREKRMIDNWNDTIAYYHSIEKPTRFLCENAEKENFEFDSLTFYRKEYLDTFPRINTVEMWKRFKKTIEE